MKILIATDAWHPQVNGVVRTMEMTANNLRLKGHTVKFLTPSDFETLSCPFYKEIPLSLPDTDKVESRFKEYNPDFVHIATEGPVGLMARSHCLRHGMSFTTSYHTRFPEYLKKMCGIPLFLSYAYFRWFHSRSRSVMVPTTAMSMNLENRGFRNVVVWNRGVNLRQFKPHDKTLATWPRPILMYVGRVSVEKNIQAFLSLKTQGTKVIVGDGPILEKLKRANPGVVFVGVKKSEELARHYSMADVMVFPSKSDTYGLVLLESLACGTPFASYPEPGPIDIYSQNPSLASRCCYISEDLQRAVDECLAEADTQSAIELSKEFSWDRCTERFLNHLTRSTTHGR
jgi:glycosyltransferase involved in cell wall biosynthesis